jgi:disulfide bond formation protein DsbB
MMIARLRVALFVSALAASLALGIALGSERWGGLVPCALCLVERMPYRVAIGAGLVGLFLPRRLAWGAMMICILAFAGAAAAAFVHVGVEWGWWASPLPECAAPNFSGMTMAQRFAAMPATPSKPCDEPTYLLSFLPISMAAMNLIAALALFFGMSIFAARNARTTP